MKKRAFSLLMALLLLFSSLSFNGMLVRAEETGEQEEPPVTIVEPEPEPEKDPLPEAGVSDDNVTYVSDGTLEALQLQNEAAEDKKAAKQALKENTDLSDKQIDELTDGLFRDGTDDDGDGEGDDDDDTPPREDDGSYIEWITVKWLTNDTFDDGEASTLTVTPSNNNSTDVRLQINYALGGDTDFKPGDIRITIPAYIIHKRNADGSDGGQAGTTLLAYPKAPATNSDFNWTKVGNTIVFTNTKRLSAATKGFIQVAFDSLYPYQIADMVDSDNFNAYIEVTTKNQHLIALRSNNIKVRFDTYARLESIVKRAYPTVQWVDKADIPDKYWVDGETQYIVVRWYVQYVTSATTYYTVDLLDTIKEADIGVEGYDDHDGFIIKAEVADPQILATDGFYHGYDNGKSRYYYVETAYPASQFLPDTQYMFYNKITATLTEDDNGEVSGPKSTIGSISWSYTDPVWIDPTGHFMVTKNGNDGKAKNNVTRREGLTSTYSDSHIWPNRKPNIHGWYGIYPSAINEMQEAYEKYGNQGSVKLSWTIDQTGYVMPWMFDDKSYQTDAELAPRIATNYTRPVMITTTDTGFSIDRYGEKLQVGTDFNYYSIEIPDTVWTYTGTPKNINPDGSWEAMYAEDGTFEYKRDYDKKHNPDIKLQIQRNGLWEDWAVVSWPEGIYTMTLADGTVQDSSNTVIILPEGTQNYRTIVVLENDLSSNEKVIQAALDFDIRVVIDLFTTDEMMTMINDAFSTTNTPVLNMYGSVEMAPSRADTGADIGTLERDGYNSVRGYTTDTMVIPTKTSRQTISMIDTQNRNIVIEYRAKVEYQSIINDLTSYKTALADGRIAELTEGIWYDLLPKGVIPDLDTISVTSNNRTKDKVIEAYTQENYKGSGRTLLVVKVELTPVPVMYRVGDMRYYEDVPNIYFKAYYSYEAYKDYGEDIHNVIAFEATGIEQFGSVEHYTGEPDDPTGENNNNVTTPNAFLKLGSQDEIDERERGWMANLDRSNSDNNFVYAGVWTHVDTLGAGTASLLKDVQVNNDGTWSEGVWTKPEDREKEERIVYEGGQYSYRLRWVPTEDTVFKNVIIYDSLDNYYPSSANNDIDANTIGHRWKGTFAGVDVSQLTDNGCAPVIYYSLIEELVLSDESNPDMAHTENTDLTNSDIWLEESEFFRKGHTLEEVKAIAIDTSLREDGTPFVTGYESTMAIIIYMTAPSGTDADAYIDADAHAFNNAYLIGMTADASGAGQEDDQFIHREYTKVGLMDNSYDVVKIWNDDDNRDGYRPDEITVYLLANGTRTGDTLKLNADNNWQGSFHHLAYTDPNGEKYRYSVEEQWVDEYEGLVEVSSASQSVVFTNTHIPERIDIPVIKTWVGDTPETRPDSIKFELYANGELISSRTVRARNNWTHTFTNLYKYENGEPIIYTVKEIISVTGQQDKILSYIVPTDPIELINGQINVINEYHPYGDLIVNKKLRSVTENLAETLFEFTFQFTKDIDGETVPVFDDYVYEVFDENGTKIDGGTVTNNGTISIHGNETIVVYDIDEYVQYRVIEAETDNFNVFSRKNDEGMILPNSTITCEFVNSYHAEGTINLKAEKTLGNKMLKPFQFIFELYQITENANGDITSRRLIETASNKSPYGSYTTLSGILYSYAEVVFGDITYTQADHGKQYVYLIKERVEDKPGYTYYESIWRVTVDVTDDGSGTMETEVHYYDITDIDYPNEPYEYYEDEWAYFYNEYNAQGDYEFVAWKNLIGRDLLEEEFFFDLYKYNPNGADTLVYECYGNDADGKITFPKVHFTEKDIGKTYIYYVVEEIGDDGTVIYDESRIGYIITVIDNEDGTLGFEVQYASFDEENNEWVAIEGAYTPTFDNPLETGSLYVAKFVSGTNPDPDTEFHFTIRFYADFLKGSEVIAELPSGDYDQLIFTENDKITVIHPDGEEEVLADGVYHFTLKQNQEMGFYGLPGGCQYAIMEEETDGWIISDATNISGTIIPCEDVIAEIENEYQPDVASIQLFGIKTFDGLPAEVDSFEFILCDEDGEEIYTVTNEDGGLIRFPRIDYHEEDAGETFVYTVREIIYDDDKIKFDEHIVTVTVDVQYNDDGILVARKSYDRPEGIMFANERVPGILKINKVARNVSQYNKDDVFTFKVTLYNEQGRPISSGEDIYWYVVDANGNIVSKNNKSFRKGDGLRSEKSEDSVFTHVPASGSIENKLNVSKDTPFTADKLRIGTPVTRASGYYDYPADDAVILDSGYSGSVIWELYSDDTLVLRPANGSVGILGTPSENHLYGMPKLWPWTESYGYRIKHVVVQSKVMGETFDSLFYQLVEVTDMDLRGLDSSITTNMRDMFDSCGKLTSVDVSGFDTSNVTNFSCMFLGCKSIESLDVTGFNTSKVTNMESMFSNMSSLKSLDLTSFDTSKVTTMNAMFYNCLELTEVKINKTKFLDTKLTNCGSMFANCEKLKRMELPQFTASKLTTISGMFNSCKSLEFVDLGNINMVSGHSGAAQMFRGCSSLADVRLGVIDSNNRAYGMSYASMFEGCSSLTYLDVSGIKYATETMEMFKGCTNLTYLDISGLDYGTKQPHYGPQTLLFNMFYNCTKLNTIELGSGYKFATDIFLTPPDDITDGKWINITRNIGPLTPYEIQNQYNRNYSGTWTWHIDTTTGVVLFDANGGSTSVPQRTVSMDDPRVQLPGTYTTRPHYNLKGWARDPDATVVEYGPNDIATDVAVMGQYVTLYAIWEESADRTYTVKHFVQNSTRTGYILRETEIFHEDVGTPVTPGVKTYQYYKSPAQQTGIVADDDSLVISYYYLAETFTVKFDRNGGDSGNMEDATFSRGVTHLLPTNLFQKQGYIFVGWNTVADGSGISYSDGQSIRNLGIDGQTITLYAQWLLNTSELEPSSGVVYVQAKAGQTIVIPDLPAGTTYTIEEIALPSYWKVLTPSSGIIEGTIEANEISLETYYNEYSAYGQVEIVAHKSLPEDELVAGQYSFQLLGENNFVMQTKTNADIDTAATIEIEDQDPIPNPWYGTAPVVFDPITFTQKDIGTKTYYIKEVLTGEDGIIYDTHIETVTVTIADKGKGYLECTAEYDSDGALFVNHKEPTALKITKQTVDSNDPDKTFKFVVNLYDKDGNPLEGNFTAYKNYEEVTETKVSHSSNIDDDGNQNGGYPSEEISDVLRFDGSDAQDYHLKVDLTYSLYTAYGELAIFDGEFTGNYSFNAQETNLKETLEWLASSGDVPEYVYLRGTQYHKEQMEIPCSGDTVHILFVASTSGRTYYGYYAVAEFTKIYYDSSITVSSGTEFTLKDGENLYIDGLPNGATYKVEEILDPETDENWTMIEKEGDEGTLQTGIISVASFTNKYEEPPHNDTVDVILQAKKHMEGGVIAQTDNFTFTLQNGVTGEELQRIGCDEFGTADSTVTFEKITYTKEDINKTYEYIISEVLGSDSNVEYDRTLYTVEVTVFANDYGEPEAKVEYKTTVKNPDATSEEDEYIDVVLEGEELPEFINRRVTDFKIEKTVDRYNSVTPVTFVFRIEGTLDGETVYSDIVQLTFDTTGVQSYRVGGLPIGTEMTVTEIYSNAGYKLAEGQENSYTITLLQLPDDYEEAANTNKVAFTNTYDDKIIGGYGVQNNYTQNEGTWTWKQEGVSEDELPNT